MNPNNCETCDYKHMQSSDQDDESHCYMFRNEPTEICMQHTARKSAGHKALVTLFMLGSLMNKNP